MRLFLIAFTAIFSVTLTFCRNIESVDDDNSINLIQLGSKLFGKPVEVREMGELDGNPEEYGPYLQGDLLIPLSSTSTDERNGMKSESFRWKKGEVPFEIRGSFSE